MEQESRVKKTLLNARVNLIFYFLTLILSFFSRKIFLECLGAEFIGLTGTLQNILGFLNLAELGIGSAIGYVLYQPIYDHDQQKINEIISVMGYLYRWIGGLILGGGCILALFLPCIYPDSVFSPLLIYFAYFSFLASSLIGYFINYRQNLLGADQRNYVVTAYFQTVTIVKTIIQLILAYYTKNLYLWVFTELSFGIIHSLILNRKINETYPWLKTDIKNGKRYLSNYPLIIRNTKKIFLHKIGIVTQWQALPLLIYAFESLKLVAYYENYTLLVTKLTGLVNSVLGSSEAGVGNLIAQGNKTMVERVLWEMMSIRSLIAGGMAIALYMLLPPFILLWLGEEYLLPDNILILIILNMCIQTIQSCLGQFIYGYGLFEDVWATITQAVIFFILGIIGGHFYGLPGIITSSIITISLWFGVWKPYYLYHYGFKYTFITYWKTWIKIMFELIVSIIVSLWFIRFVPLASPYSSYYALIIYSIVCLFIYFLISMTVFYISNPHIRSLIGRFIKR